MGRTFSAISVPKEKAADPQLYDIFEDKVNPDLDAESETYHVKVKSNLTWDQSLKWMKDHADA